MNKWVGLKAVVYNIMRDNETSGVKLEMYIDGSNINNWTKVSDITDSGGWYTKSNNTEFFSAAVVGLEIILLSMEDRTSFFEPTIPCWISRI